MKLFPQHEAPHPPNNRYFNCSMLSFCFLVLRACGILTLVQGMIITITAVFSLPVLLLMAAAITILPAAEP